MDNELAWKWESPGWISQGSPENWNQQDICIGKTVIVSNWLMQYGGWADLQSATCKLKTQEKQWCNLVQDWRPEVESPLKQSRRKKTKQNTSLFVCMCFYCTNHSCIVKKLHVLSKLNKLHLLLIESRSLCCVIESN